MRKTQSKEGVAGDKKGQKKKKEENLKKCKNVGVELKPNDQLGGGGGNKTITKIQKYWSFPKRCPALDLLFKDKNPKLLCLYEYSIKYKHWVFFRGVVVVCLVGF